MPYSPIRIEQLDITQLSGYIADVIDGTNVLLSGSQTIDGEKTFLNLFISSERINRKVINLASYDVLNSDYYLAINTSGGGKTIVLPTGVSSGKVFRIKDVAGMAATNIITITGNGLATFDYGLGFQMIDNYGSIDLIAGSGNNYEIM